MHPGGALALAAIIIAASAGIIIRQRRRVGWRRIVAVALLVWLGVAGLVVLWVLIAAVAGQRAYFGAIQVPRSALLDPTVGITLGTVAMHGVSPGLMELPRGSIRHAPVSRALRWSRPARRVLPCSDKNPLQNT
jgi:hypothetical protein